MISSYGDQSTTQGIILHIVSCFRNAASIALNALPETPYVLYMQLQHQGNHRNGAIKHILHESDPRRDHQQTILYSFCRSMLALHLAVKILLQIFL